MGSLPANIGAITVLIDPNNPKRVYAAAETGLYRSDDAGQSWQAADEGLPQGDLRALALDPRQPMRLYAADLTGALYVTEDGASSWQPLAGPDAGAGR